MSVRKHSPVPGLKLLQPIDRLHPLNALLRECFPSRPQLAFVQLEIIHRSGSQRTEARIPGADPVHQRAAGRAKMVRHCVVARGCAALCVFSQVGLAAYVLQRRVLDQE